MFIRRKSSTHKTNEGESHPVVGHRQELLDHTDFMRSKISMIKQFQLLDHTDFRSSTQQQLSRHTQAQLTRH